MFKSVSVIKNAFDFGKISIEPAALPLCEVFNLPLMSSTEMLLSSKNFV